MTDTIHILVAQYFQLVDPSHLAFPPDDVLKRSDIQTALYERMFDDTITPLPPSSYRFRVLKIILALIEEAFTEPDEDEIVDNLMTSWSNLIAQPKPTALQQAQQLSHVKYTAPLLPNSPGPERSIITFESRGLILSGGTTGFRTWEAALHLGSFLASPAGEALVRGKRVVELGAGAGFLSLLCARHLGVRGVVSTDRELALIDNIQKCVGLNMNKTSDMESDLIPVYPTVWEWGKPLELTRGLASFTESDGLRFDIALGADLVYDPDLIPLLISTVRDLFENYHLEHFIIAATLRNENTFQTFLRDCETNKFTIERLPFESTPSEKQTGFFHETSVPIRTYRISRTS